uniref:Uncharacterized protein n=1 Tax=Tetradesmus obliquus TaxID=3088 RepID=A0A383V625_TETOB|eukprot:jgi/Sobl393_1/14951/SZX60413.1
MPCQGTDITSDVNSNGGGWAYDTWDGTSMLSHPAAQCIPALYHQQTRRYGTISGGVLNLLAPYNCMKAIFGDPTSGSSGGGSTPVDCTAQSVPECVLASSGVIATGPCSTSQTAYCLAVGTTTCSYSYKDSGAPCSVGSCSGSSATCASAPTTLDCTARSLPICVDAMSGSLIISPCITSSSSYCERVSSSAYCSYSYSSSSTSCGIDGTTCSGSSADCPFGGGGGGGGSGGGGGNDYTYVECTNPPVVEGATWESSCAYLSLPGETCTATCESTADTYDPYDWSYDFRAIAYRVECREDGT